MPSTLSATLKAAAIGAALGLPVALLVVWYTPQLSGPALYALGATGVCGFLTFLVASQWREYFAFANASLPGLFAASVFAMLILPLVWVVPLLSHWQWWNWVTAVAVGYCFTLFGIIVLPLAYASQGGSLKKRLHRAWDGEPAVALGLLALCLALSAYWVLTVRDFALFAALTGSPTIDELKDLRENALKLLDGPIVKIVSYLRNLLFPFATTMLFVVAWTKGTRAWWTLFWLAFAANFVIAVISLEKLYGVMLLMQIFFAWMFVTRRRVSFGVLFASGLAVVAIYLLVNLAFLDLEGANLWFEIYSHFVWRIIAVPASLVGAYIDYFSFNDFLLGRTLPFLNRLFPGELWIENVICREYFSGGDTCHANAGYIAYLWADFGWFGVTVGAFVAGLILSGLQTYCLSARPTAANAALRATIGVHVLTVAFSTFGGFATWAATALLLAFACSWAAGVVSGSGASEPRPAARTHLQPT